MRTQIAKTEYLPAEYIPPTFLTRTPSPYSAGWRWGLLSRKIFFDFYFSDFVIVLVLIVTLILVLYLSDFDLEFTSSRLRFSTLIIIWDSVFSILYFDQFLLVIFPSYLFRLVSALSILCFISSTLYLFDSSACYKQTSMLIWVCFMLILAILRLSDVFSFVLGVVYRLGIK